jgi:flagellar assembly protein FliH
MSSFRIDRQYVSFISAEAHSLAAAGRTDETHADAGDKKNDARLSAEEYKKQCERLRERLIKDAEEKADQIITAAENEAARIRSEAEAKAAGLIEEAGKKAEQIRSKARDEGYDEGLKNAEKDNEAKRCEARDCLASLQKSLRDAYSQLVEGLRDEVVNLVFGVVRKIIGVKLSESDEVFIGLINSAVEELKHIGTAAIHISSEDYRRYFGKEQPAEQNGRVKVSVVEEEDYGCGDLVVESEGEILDYSIGRQLERLEKVFMEAGKA